ncbi:cbb3-type cytochrome oxidase assembly protein CcoS [Cytophagaceae bacterium DM2B3-1]|uniref:Cbb3-type cytochrome oxidase assembly protein CcoS n=1 Tax=Xanthocytophaga flava TaxID=3048013 RepID=A0ABT7CG33_9BACT|nr:cbb3-type cytochrome oxidase assembly protein CcoS [Xanthocytophaga flavus]MDJ1466682.1 cbb3-type cytochrome oxidase assembly protein CcoS [Xanthocytophaga flavus]MDJ1492678.1 cbb3-type cytochrome oxidase assembly protein CcoS [Xanthocytophaga flavus]
MSIIYILLTVSLIMASVFLGIFLWNLRNGQFDDDYTPSVRMLFDDEDISAKQDRQTKTSG